MLYIGIKFRNGEHIMVNLINNIATRRFNVSVVNAESKTIGLDSSLKALLSKFNPSKFSTNSSCLDLIKTIHEKESYEVVSLVFKFLSNNVRDHAHAVDKNLMTGDYIKYK